MTLLSFSGVSLDFGGAPLLRDVTFTVARGERWGVVGRNGTGKTSLFRLATGRLEPTRGTVARASGLRASLLDQYRDFAGARTVWEAAAEPLSHLLELERSLAEQAEALGALGEGAGAALLARYDRDLERFRREGGYEVASRVDAVLHGLGFDPEVARTLEVAVLSGGERGRLGLARQLAAPADLLLLDEPTNHLDLATTRWLEGFLRGIDATVMVVSHDRAFLEAVADHVLHLEGGTTVPYACGYSAFVAQRAERRLAQERAFRRQQRTVAAEEDYIRRNIAGQNSRQAKGRRRRLARLPRLGPPPGETGAMVVRLAAGERGGDQVLVADRVTLALEGRTLVEDWSAVVTRGEVVGLVGPNGAGKSTLLRTLWGERPPQGGSVRLGASVRPAYYRQDLAQVPLDRSLFDVIHDLRPSWNRGQVQGHLGRFDFPGDSVLRSAGSLSGGERARLGLAMLELGDANLLLLDEPTNHLDVESIEALEDALEAYDGTVIVVSHDRAFLRALTSRTWVLEDARIADFPGGFEEWEAVSLEREREAAAAEAAAGDTRRERQRKEARRSGDARREHRTELRRARRRLEEVEARVARLEEEAAELARRLEDPSLYGTGEGARAAAELDVELQRRRRELDEAMEEWAEASAEVERLAAIEAG